MTDGTKDAERVFGVATKIVELASDSPELSEAGHTFAKSALTIAKAIDNVLVPIAAVNFAFDKARVYFETKFKKDMEAVTEDIPAEKIIEPSASVAAPALQGLAFSHEEPDLKSMYLNLLGTAMDARRARSAHPAYAEVIRQLTADEARMFNDIKGYGRQLPVVTLMGQDHIGYGTVLKDIIDMRNQETDEQVAVALLNVPSMIDNWLRLGLISITYDLRLIASGSYDWVETRPEYVELDRKYRKVVVKQGILELSSFGKSFADAVSG